jgi:O-antigen/teichoic acid export membrane protein
VNNFRNVAKNTSYLIASEFVLKVLGTLWVIFLANKLSVELYGRYNFVNAFIGLFAFVPDLGVGLIVIRDIAKNHLKAPEFIGNALVLNSFFAFITLALIIIVTSLLGYPPETRLLLFIASVTLFISVHRSAGILFFEGTEQFLKSSTLNVINTCLLLLGGVIGYFAQHSLVALFVGMLLGTIISTGVTWFFVLRHMLPVFSKNLSAKKYLLLQGLPLGIAALSYTVYTKIDAVLLGSMLGEAAVGIYTSTTPFVVALIQLLNVPFMGAIYPALSRISTHPKRFNTAVYKALLVISAWSFPVAIGVALFAHLVIPLIFGEKYADAIPVLRIVIFSVPFMSLSALLYKVLILQKRQRLYLYISLLGAGINILLNMFFIPLWSYYGAAVAGLLTQILLFIIYFVVVFRKLRI